MSGVGLVGFSGSLIKDAVKEFVGQSMPTWIASASSDLPPPEPIEKPEATTVLVGMVFLPRFRHAFLTTHVRHLLHSLCPNFVKLTSSLISDTLD